MAQSRDDRALREVLALRLAGRAKDVGSKLELASEKRRKIQHDNGLIAHDQDKPAPRYIGKDVIPSQDIPGSWSRDRLLKTMRPSHEPEAKLPGFTFANDPHAGKPKEVKRNRRTKYLRASDRLVPVIVRIG
jgi:hypothetical protein